MEEVDDVSLGGGEGDAAQLHPALLLRHSSGVDGGVHEAGQGGVGMHCQGVGVQGCHP